MAGETILIVEDAPESLKFAAGVLRGEGYKVTIASTAEQALSTLRFLQPQLMLVDFVLPGMNGLELTSRVKQDARLQNTIVVALTGCALPGDESKARQAGCDGYLTKPIDARALATRVRRFLDRSVDSPFAGTATEGQSEGATQGIIGLPQDELVELQESFLKGGKGVSRQLLVSIDGQFDEAKARRTVHQWIGTAGLLGYPSIAYRAREVEAALRTPPFAAGRLRGPVTNLARSFYNPTAPVSEAPSQAAARALNGKPVALIGLTSGEADLMCHALELVGARARLYESDQSAYSEAVTSCQLVVVHVRPDKLDCRWLAREAPGLPALPTVFLGAPEDLAALSPAVQARAHALLTEGCLPEETLMRLRLAISQGTPARPSPRAGGELVVADSDATSRGLVRAKLEEHGLKCQLATNGPDTLLLLREVKPPAAVLDINMDGFEVLAAIRAESMPIRTILLITQPHENEILRAFTLGAEDYLAQPFSALELVARLKRLIG